MLTRSRQGGHLFAIEIDRPQEVILGIGNVQGLVDQDHPLRMVKLGVSVSTVFVADGTRPDDIDQFAVERTDDQAIMIAVGNEESAALFVNQDLAGKS